MRVELFSRDKSGIDNYFLRTSYFSRDPVGLNVKPCGMAIKTLHCYKVTASALCWALLLFGTLKHAVSLEPNRKVITGSWLCAFEEQWRQFPTGWLFTNRWNELRLSWMALVFFFFLLESGIGLQMEEVVCFYQNVPLCCLFLQLRRGTHTHTHAHHMGGKYNWSFNAS